MNEIATLILSLLKKMVIKIFIGFIDYNIKFLKIEWNNFDGSSKINVLRGVLRICN